MLFIIFTTLSFMFPGHKLKADHGTLSLVYISST